MSATRQAVQAGRLPINPCLLQLIMVLPLRVWQGYTWGKYRAAKRWSPQDGAERPEEKTSYTSSDSEAPGRATRCPLSGSRHHPASRANLEASRGYNVGGTVDRRVPRHPWESRITTARERDRTVNRGEGGPQETASSTNSVYRLEFDQIGSVREHPDGSWQRSLVVHRQMCAGWNDLKEWKRN